MSAPFRRIRRRLAALVGRRRFDADLDEELAFHLEMEQRRLEETGLPPHEARRRAALEFGGVQRFREETRDVRGTGFVFEMLRDCRLGFRALRRRPVSAALLLFTLSLGIGGSAAFFGVVEGVLLSPLPYPEPDRIVTLWEKEANTGAPNEVPPGIFLEWRTRSRSFAHLSAMEPYGLDWASPDGPVYLPTWLVYEHFFDTFGVPPLLGRLPRSDEHVAGRGDVVVLGYDLWQSRFGGDTAAVGRIVTIDNRPQQIIGVMPKGFATPSDAVVWAPKVLAGWETGARRRGGFYRVFGRLAPGVSLADAAAEMAIVSRGIAEAYPDAGVEGAIIEPLADRILGPARQPLLLLLGAVLVVFAIVVANAASLELARALTRAREFAVRGALGASRGRLTRQRLAESASVAAIGSALGFGVAWLATAALRASVPAGFPRAETLGADGRVLIFAVIGSLIAAAAIGIAPAALASRDRVTSRLGGSARGASAGRGVRRLQAGLVVAQVGLCLTLLVGAALLTRSFAALLGADRGFGTDGVAVVSVQSWDNFPTAPARVEFVRQVTERLRATPGIRAAGMATSVPLMETIGSEHATLRIDGQPQEGEPPFVQYAAVTPGFFEALSVPLRAGRMFDPSLPGGTALVNEAFVRRYFPGGSALGARLRLGQSRTGEPAPLEVIGVVGDVRRHSLAEPPVPWVYVSHAQNGSGANAFVVTGSGSEASLLAAARRAVWDVSPVMPLHNETTMAALLGGSVRDRQFILVVVGVFAAMALVLAAAGLYALLSFMTEERTREIGVRMALGAGRSEVVRLVLRRGALLTAAGLGAGAVASAAGIRGLDGMLYGVRPADPAALIVAPAVLLLAAFLACWIPARRAARADPTIALRSE